ncbi:MAG: hypothetical protein AAF206_24570 [Bacteroidota bacterium]
MESKKMSRSIWVTMLLMVIALGMRLDHRWHFRKMVPDTEVKMVVAANQLAGHGFATRRPSLADLSQ